jgi:hypothetical protein
MKHLKKCNEDIEESDFFRVYSEKLQLWEEK